jgi:putative exporter of polyketide antibiotics
LAPMKSAQYFFVKIRFSMIGIISSAFLVTLTDRMDSVEGSKMLKLRVTSFPN